MSRKNNRNKIKAQYELEVEKERMRKEKLMKKRERKASAQKGKETMVKKVSTKVLRRMRMRQMEKTMRGEMDVDEETAKKQKKGKAEKMETDE
ncbi:unnamed protein product [Peronospora effusa]|uniref:Uncharacterized protein n=1 Tax=Peronospora effusa TaxID=542832 RepID=A0A3M6V6N8_9STRA|nr:hypothetical protein DD238_005752 [Peronospora effusa]CAI5726502.1 unnamed protein product [Peronospora effusa]